MSRNLVAVSRTIALVVATLGCGGSVSPEGCVGGVEVAVVPTVPLTFSWSPACGMSYLSVVTVPSTYEGVEEPMWGFSVPEARPIRPAIRYGVAPRGATVWAPSRPLVAGTMYRVRVFHSVGGDGLVATGERVFTR